MDEAMWIFKRRRCIRPVPAPTCGSPRGWKRARATAALGTVAPATHLTSGCRRPPDVDRTWEPIKVRAAARPTATRITIGLCRHTVYAEKRCDTRSHEVSEYVDWRSGLMPET
jgi:hypothetical protein